MEKKYITVAETAIQSIFPQKKELKFTESQIKVIKQAGIILAAYHRKKLNKKPFTVRQTEYLIKHKNGKRLLIKGSYMVASYPVGHKAGIENVLRRVYREHLSEEPASVNHIKISNHEHFKKNHPDDLQGQGVYQR